MTLGERLKQAGEFSPLDVLIREGEVAANTFRLPFSRLTAKGRAGNWAGAGVGSSIDFQDHRPYVPGDDPRYINWQAFARTGHYTMKLYREEVSPRLDVIFDASKSIFNEVDKARKAVSLLFFVCHSAWRNSASLKVYTALGRTLSFAENDSLRSGEIAIPEDLEGSDSPMDWARIPLRPQSLRVVISDLLFDQEPSIALRSLGRQGTHVVFFCLFTKQEWKPDWLGNVELLDCEIDRRARRYFTREDLDNYRLRYDAHFSAWSEAVSRISGNFARIDAEGSLEDSLLTVANLKEGVELCQ